MSIQHLLEALDVQEGGARALADDLRTHIQELHSRLREAETHLKYLAITRKTVHRARWPAPCRDLQGRPARAPGLPPHPRRL